MSTVLRPEVSGPRSRTRPSRGGVVLRCRSSPTGRLRGKCVLKGGTFIRRVLIRGSDWDRESSEVTGKKIGETSHEAQGTNDPIVYRATKNDLKVLVTPDREKGS